MLCIALNQTYANADLNRYRKLEDSIRNAKNEKREHTPAAVPAVLSAPSVPQAYPAQQLPNPIALPSISSMTNHGYSNTLGVHTGYSAQYGIMNGAMSVQRAYQPAPQGMSSHPAGFLSALPRAAQQLRFGGSSQGPTFHPSPFYQVVQRVGPVHLCQGNAQLPGRAKAMY